MKNLSATRHALLLIASLFALNLIVVGHARGQAAGLADGFNPNANSDVATIVVQPDGKFLAGGGFTSIGGQTRNRIARFNADGTLDMTFNPDAGGQVHELLLQADGKIIVAGNFTTIGGQARNRMARLNTDGSVDGSYDPNAASDVLDMALQADGKVVVVGLFTFIGGQVRNYIARLNTNGSVDLGFDPDAANMVNAVAIQPDGKIVVGGLFTGMNNGQTRARIARLESNGTLDNSFNPGANASVLSLAIQSDGKILAGGVFTNISSTSRDYFARLNANGTIDGSFSPGSNNRVEVIKVQADQRILVGGFFTQMGGSARKYIARFDASGGLDSAFDPNASSYVESIVTQADGKILVGGIFGSIGGEARNRMARLGGDGLAPEIAVEQPVNSALADGAATIGFGSLLFGETSTREFTVRNIGSADLTGLTTTITGAHSGDFTVTTMPSGPLSGGASTTFTVTFVPGDLGTRTATLHLFTNDADESPFDIDFSGITLSVPPVGSSDASFYTSVLTNVSAIALHADGRIVVGGAFSQFGTESRNRIARCSEAGVVDLVFNPDANGTVNVLTVQPDGKVLAGGAFTNIGGATRNRLARLEDDGTADTGFAPTLNGAVTALVLQADGKIIVGGAFTTVSGQSRQRIARLNADGTLDTGFTASANGQVYALALQADGKILLGGAFTSVSGQTRNYIARLNANGSLDTGFNPNADDYVYALAVQPDQQIVVGGYFNNIGAQPRYYLARLNTNGSAETGFIADADDAVLTLALQADGKIVLGGYFTTVLLPTRNYIARIHPNGSVDTDFDPDANDYVYALAVQQDQKILVGGRFTNIGGKQRNCLARLQYASNTPEIVLHDPAGYVIGTGGYSIIGSGQVGAQLMKTFTIQNTGTGNLTGFSVTKSGGASTHFTVSNPILGTLAPNQTTTFNVYCTIPSIGANSTTITLTSNDADENPIVFGVTANGLAPPAPDIYVYGPDSEGLNDGLNTVDFSTSYVGVGVTKTFTVENVGNATLTLGTITFDGANPTDFAAGTIGNTSLAPSATTTFSVTFTPGAVGARTGTLHLANNDPTETPFDIDLTGEGLPTPPPEIVVQQPSGNNLTDNASTVDFGTALPLGTTSRTFRIRNTGNGPLTGIVISVDGTNASEFTFNQLLPPVVNADSSRSFTVTFTPVAAGARSAALHIVSNDADESPFNIALIGTGGVPITDWRQTNFGTTTNTGDAADDADPDHDGNTNLMEFATGGAPGTSGAAPGTISPPENDVIEFFYTRNKQAMAELFYQVEWNDVLAADGWIGVGVTETILSDNGLVQQVKALVPTNGNDHRFVHLLVTRP